MNRAANWEMIQKRIAKYKDRSDMARRTVSRKASVVRQSKVTPQRPTANPPTKPKDYITVDVVQGLGDIFWIYQKLAPFYQTINFNICCVTLDNVQRRALPWMSLLPKVKEVTMKLVKGPVYAQMATTKYNLAEVMQAWNAGKTPPPYAVNKWLEEGVRIDEIDQSPVEKNVALKSEHFDVPFEKFMTLYVSGNAKKKGLPSWSIQQWLEYIDLFYVRYNPDLPIVVIGADFDKEAIDDISLGLVERKIDTISVVNEQPAKVVDILQRSEFFIGYQSGLNILADNLDTPQMMLYFDNLKPMLYTWCKKENIKTKFFATVFSQTPKDAIKLFDFSKHLH